MNNIVRLRPLPSPEELLAMYPEPHDHMLYGRGHGERVNMTIDLGLTIPEESRRVVADLSCGNGAIALSICSNRPSGLHLGDVAGEVAQKGENGYLGPIEDTIHQIPHVQVFVCSETLEHLDNPISILNHIRRAADTLILSTPLECWEDANDEHLWAWDRAGVEHLMDLSGWTPRKFASVDSREYGEPYLYGIWVAE